MEALKPYRKAIVAGVCSAVVVAATFYQWPPLQIAAAAITPLMVYLVPNKAAS